MSDIQKWFREVIKDKVSIAYQSHGGFLDGTMTSGDTTANTVKFPTAGRTEVYQLTGAIENVPNNGPGLDTVQCVMKDFEASTWWRTQDAMKAGPSEQGTLATLLTKAIRRKRDWIKLDALSKFVADASIATIGSATAIPDLTHFMRAQAEIEGNGLGDEDEIFTIIPAMWANQLKFYKEFSSADYVGDENAPFSKTTRKRMRTIEALTFITVPDEYFKGPDDNSLYTYMWSKNALGAETPWNKETADISTHPEKQGTPHLAKTSISGAAVGIMPDGVRRIHLKKITDLTRPA